MTNLLGLISFYKIVFAAACATADDHTEIIPGDAESWELLSSSIRAGIV